MMDRRNFIGCFVSGCAAFISVGLGKMGGFDKEEVLNEENVLKLFTFIQTDPNRMYVSLENPLLDSDGNVKYGKIDELNEDGDFIFLPSYNSKLPQLKKDALGLVKCCFEQGSTIESIKKYGFCFCEFMPTDDRAELVSLGVFHL